MRWTMPVLLLACQTGFSQDFNPIPARNGRSLALAFLRFLPEQNNLKLGQKSFEVDWMQANDFRSMPGLEEDAEVFRLAARGYWGMGKGMMAWIEAPLLSRGGGFLDPIIDWWHAHVLGWSDSNRNVAPFGRSIIERTGQYLFGSATGFGDISGGLSYRLSSRFNARVGLKLPTGNAKQLLGSGGMDAGICLDTHIPLLRKLVLYGQVGLVAQSRGSVVPHVRGLVDQEALALALAPNTRDTWLVQWQSEMAPTKSGVSGADATHRIVTFAYRRKLDQHRSLDLYFSEDRDLFSGGWPEGANIGPDFSIGIRISCRW